MSRNSTGVGPKVLLIDIETTPNIVHAWGLRDQNIGLNQIVQPQGLLCFAAKWLGTDRVMFCSGENMVLRAHGLMSTADAIVHYNGSSFDIPMLNSEILLAGFVPPSPSKQIDLYRVVRKHFRFPSGKLDYLTKALGLAGKVKHSGHELWTRCMAGDPKAWKEMREYNIRDVEMLDLLYKILRPWITTHPNLNLFRQAGTPEGCPNCGRESLAKQGFSYTNTGKYQRYVCNTCGRWSTAGRRVDSASVRGTS